MGAGFCMVLNTIGKCLVWSWALGRRTWHQFELEELERVEGKEEEKARVGVEAAVRIQRKGIIE